MCRCGGVGLPGSNTPSQIATCSSSFTSRTPRLGNGEISLRMAMFSSFSTVVIYPVPAATAVCTRDLDRERREVWGNAQVHLPDGLIPGLRCECVMPYDLN